MSATWHGLCSRQGIMRTKLQATLPFFIVATGWAAVPLASHCTTSAQTDDPNNAPSTGGGHVSTEGGVVSGGPCTRDQECLLPSSKCGEGGLIYYTDAKCVSGACQYQEQVMGCLGSCAPGGCFGTTTAGSFLPLDDGAAGQGGGNVEVNLDAATEHAEILPPDGGVCLGEDASVCKTPPSRCADARWFAYFTNTSCGDAGECHWEVAYKDCGQLGCGDPGGCRLNVTK
jgi:hypothetical protein